MDNKIMDKKIMNECYSCMNRANVSGNCHIKCMDPDPNMEGREIGIRRGWFNYPHLFDPVWKTKLCANYKERERSEIH